MTFAGTLFIAVELFTALTHTFFGFFIQLSFAGTGTRADITQHIAQTKACGQNSNLYFFAKFFVCSQAKLGFHIRVELAHKLVNFVHFVHHQAFTFFGCTESDVHQYFL